jgi:endonuclease G
MLPPVPRRPSAPACRRLIALILVFAITLLSLPPQFTPFIPAARAASSTIVISEVDADTPLANVDTANEWFELRNVSAGTLTLSNWSITDNTSSDPIPTVTLGPGGHVIVAATAAGFSSEHPGFTGTVLTVADASIGNGLANGGDLLILRDGNGVAVDGLSWGSNTTVLNPSAGIDSSSNTNQRTAAVDTDTNADWTRAAETPNGSTNATTSTPPAGAGNANPASVAPGGTTLLTVKVTPGTNPASVGHGVSANLSSIGGPVSQGFFDDGSHGDQLMNDNVFSFSAAVGSSVTGGQKTIPFTVTETAPLARTSNGSIALTVLAQTSPSGAGTANPGSVLPGESTTLSVSVTPGTNPPSTGLVVRADLSTIGGLTDQAFSNGGSGNTYTFAATVATGTPTGQKMLPVNITDGENRTGSTTITLTVEAPPPPADHLVVSQIYGGGGQNATSANASATYRNDYVELYNPTSSPIPVNGWSLQYASDTGSGWSFNLTTLAGTVGPGQYYLVKLASGGASGTDLPEANATGNINMSATAGKIALVKNTEALTGATPSCPTEDPDLVDLVGWGSANCKEGAATAPAPVAPAANTTAIFRKSDGQQDKNQNGSDFFVGQPNPRRTAPFFDAQPKVTKAETDDDFDFDPPTPFDASFNVFFSEPVEVDGDWYSIQCTQTGAHTGTVYPGTTRWIITPDANLTPGEDCTFKVFASKVRDSDLNDEVPNTDYLEADYERTFTVATGNPAPETPDVHLLFGNPTDEAADYGQPTNYLMVKPEFALSYNRDRGTPNWVSWHLSDDWTGFLARRDTFRPDTALPVEWRILHTDYSGSGFDRGHVVASADRAEVGSTPLNQATFLMSNMIPQAPDNNRKTWNNMEQALRDIVEDTGKEMYIVAGGAGTGGTGDGGFRETIANGRVAVPAFTWKVALVLDKTAGDDVSRVNCSTRTIAVIVPNTNGTNPDWTQYLKSVDQVERLTGYDFFENLPDPYERCVEAGVNGNNPPLDTDNDGQPDTADPDDDNDGQSDADEVMCGSNPLVASSESPDNDSDNSPDCVDADDDDDGVADDNDAFPFDPTESIDTDGDGTGNRADTDDDGDGASDVAEVAAGSDPLDANSTPEVCDGADNDGDGGIDEEFANTDGDSQANCVDADDDDDGVSDAVEIAAGSDPLNPASRPEVCDGLDNDLDGSTDEGFANTDGDGQADCVDADDDGDGVNDAADNCPLKYNPSQADFDGDGIGDTCETTPVTPTNKDQCMNGGWMTWTPRFKNQGDCVSYTNNGK